MVSKLPLLDPPHLLYQLDNYRVHHGVISNDLSLYYTARLRGGSCIVHSTNPTTYHCHRHQGIRPLDFG